MQLEALRSYLMEKKGVTEEQPFGPDALVYKVMGKMFALISWAEMPLRITLKCDPEHAVVLRKTYEAVRPGYYMSKRHWNTITLDGTILDGEILEMIDDSYAPVVKGLKKVLRQELESISSSSSLSVA